MADETQPSLVRNKTATAASFPDPPHLNARSYDPALAMLIQPDLFEVTEPGVGTNRYAYSFNDPVTWKDPEGNEAVTVAAVVIGATVVTTVYSVVTNPAVQEAAEAVVETVALGLAGLWSYVTRDDEEAEEAGVTNGEAPWGGIKDVEPHPDGDIKGGSQQQGIKSGGES